MSVIHVAVGVILDQQRVLLSRRQQGVHLEGYWEFPGGKLDTGETPEKALGRELHEELGIFVQQYHPLITIPFDYETHEVQLHVFEIREFSGLPQGREGQHIEWVQISELRVQDLPPANRGIVSALHLPDRYLITPEPAHDNVAFLAHLRQCMLQGLNLIQLRAKSLSIDEYKRLALSVLDLVREFPRARILLNAHAELVQELGAHGVHLTAQQIREFDSRPLPEGLLVAASCHDEKEVKQACGSGADFVVLSPLRETPSHPGASVLGWSSFESLAAVASVPVYALGGMLESDIDRVRRCGGQGIAAISGLWRT